MEKTTWNICNFSSLSSFEKIKHQNIILYIFFNLSATNLEPLELDVRNYSEDRTKYIFIYIWSDFDRASSLICGNKMPTRCNRWFLLHILLLVQHVSGTIMSIIRSSRLLYRCLLPVVFGALVFQLSVWCGTEGYVSGLRATAATICIILSSSWWWT
jgi:hypothetical protein